MFAAEPYEVISFKVPNFEIDKARDKFFAHWEPDKKVYTLQLYFRQGLTLVHLRIRVHSLNDVPYLAWNLESRCVLGAYLR
jgi:hypothetical protein